MAARWRAKRTSVGRVPVIDVQRSPELQAAIIACKQVDADLRKAIFAATRATVGPLWSAGLAKRSHDKVTDLVIVKGARAAVRTDGFSLMAATSKKRLRRGLQPSESWRPLEFGIRTYKKRVIQTSRLGKKYELTKTVNKQFPEPVKYGKVAFDTASEVGTKAVVAWVQAVVTTIVHATEGEAE